MLARGFGDQVLSQHQPIGSPSMPTQDECTMAFLAQLLQVFTGFIGPLIIYCVKHESRFVKFHALQALIWQLCYMVVVFGGMIFFFFCMFATVFHSASSGHPSNQPPPGFLLFFPLIWLLAMFGWVANLVLGIMYGIKANRGEWAIYPVIGKWCLSRMDQPVPAQSWAP
jgi:uncharacterized protein